MKHPPKRHLEHWNRLAERYGLRGIRLLSAKRVQALKARLKQYGPEYWRLVEEELKRLNEFADGAQWLDFDYVTRESGALALLEGKWRKEEEAPDKWEVVNEGNREREVREVKEREEDGGVISWEEAKKKIGTKLKGFGID